MKAVLQLWANLQVIAALREILGWNHQLHCSWISNVQNLGDTINVSSLKLLNLGVFCYIALDNEYTRPGKVKGRQTVSGRDRTGSLTFWIPDCYSF